MAAIEDLGYILPIIETASDLAQALDAHGDNLTMRWYLDDRTAALVAAGDWNPLEHPRGKDGKFIEVLS